MKKTTAAHLKIYKDEVLRLIEKYKLDQWEVHFVLVPKETSRAAILVNYEGRIVTFELASEWDNTIVKLTNAEVKLSAKHEVIELLLAPISFLGSQRFGTEEEYNAAREEVVRKFEKIL